MVGAKIVVGTRSKAPRVLTGLLGMPSWSGKDAEALSEEEQRQVFAYAEDAGERQGLTDAIRHLDTAGLDQRSSPFHPDFLGGVPHAVWRMGYRRGIRQARAGRSRSDHRMVLA